MNAELTDVIFKSHRRPERIKRRSIAGRRTQNTPTGGTASEQSAVTWLRVLARSQVTLAKLAGLEYDILNNF